ncbi:hypothetical protein GCM10022254_57090 [Actinomadura meridiana]|uniref:Uncharacterized protein n=1 Tax=Actinomadura meridiana TaxID=559626 RepID=A0ABP8CGD2_9ACTN
MNSESDQRPGGPPRARESAPDPPGPAAPPAEATAPPPTTPPTQPETVPSPSVPEAIVTDVTTEPDVPPRPGPQGDISPEQVREHLRRRAIFLRELAEARELRRRVTPHRSRRARIHAALRRRTFRIN